MANLESTQLKDGFQTLVSIGTTTVGGHPSNPATGSLTNGKGTALTQVTLGLGSVSAPSYSFTGDTNTGMFSSGADALNLATGGNNRMTIASGGNISIGTANSSAALQVGTSSEEILRLERDTTTNDSFIDLTYASGHSNDSDANHEYAKIRTKVVANLSGLESSELHFQTINAGTIGDKMVITKEGNVGIGVTAPSQSLDVSGEIEFNAKLIARDNNLKFGVGGSPNQIINISSTDNAVDLGFSTSLRFRDIYAANGTIQTSDEKQKQDIEELNEAEKKVAQKAKTLIKKYRMISSVEEKGDDARIHVGIIAQDLEKAFADEGLDAGRYGMFIKETTTNDDGEEQDSYAIRYNELLAFIISSI